MTLKLSSEGKQIGKAKSHIKSGLFYLSNLLELKKSHEKEGTVQISRLTMAPVEAAL